MKIAELEPTSARGQIIILLLGALFILKGGRSKQEVLGLIRERAWFAFEPEDKLPYPSTTSTEPRWETLVAWARKDALEAGLLDSGLRDNWQLSKDGHNAYVGVRNYFRDGEISVRSCFFWAPSFKREVDPNWISDGTEATRPDYVYKDKLPSWMKSTRGTALQRDMMDFIKKSMAEDSF